MSSENEMLKTKQHRVVYATLNGEVGCVGRGRRKKSNYTGVSRFICFVLIKMGYKLDEKSWWSEHTFP